MAARFGNLQISTPRLFSYLRINSSTRQDGIKRRDSRFGRLEERIDRRRDERKKKKERKGRERDGKSETTRWAISVRRRLSTRRGARDQTCKRKKGKRERRPGTASAFRMTRLLGVAEIIDEPVTRTGATRGLNNVFQPLKSP